MQNKIKEIRESQNITQEELSKKANVSRTIISFLETERRLVTTNVVMFKISNALGKKVSEVFNIDDKENF